MVLKDGAYFCYCTDTAHHMAIWLKCYVCARVTNDVINYATKYMTKIMAKFSYDDQIKANEHQNSSMLRTSNC